MNGATNRAAAHGTPPRPTSRGNRPSAAGSLRQRGFGLVELMVSLVLGLLVVGGAIVMFSATRQASNSSENLSRIQESVRTSYDLMVREIREAGATPCDSELMVGNVLNNAQGAGATWWATWSEPLRGYDGSTAMAGIATGAAVAERVAGTAALTLRMVQSVDGVTVSSHNVPNAVITLNRVNHGIADSDILMVCNYRQAAIFQVSSANLSNATVVHNNGNTSTPGNCSKGLGVPTDCGSTNGKTYEFQPNSLVGRLHVSGWYIGNNGRTGTGGRSLYRVTKTGSEEVADGVRDMQLSFLVNGSAAYVAATAVADWTTVTAVRVNLSYEGPDQGVSTAGTAQRLVRDVAFTVNLRNRQP